MFQLEVDTRLWITYTISRARVGAITVMDTLETIWAWLSDPGNQRTLGLLGGALAAAVAAVWGIFKYIRPPKSLDSGPSSIRVIEQHGEEGATAVFQTGKGKVYVTKGISPEEFDRVAAELGITQAAVKNFFKILEQKDVPPEEYDNTFRKIAKTHKELEEELKGFSAGDPAVTALKEEAREALIEGDFGKTEKLLREAREKDIQAAKQMKKTGEERMLSAAASTGEVGNLKKIQLDYDGAASYYHQAVDLLPKGNDLIVAKYQRLWGGAFLESGKYGEAEKPLTRSLEIYEEVLGPNHPEVAIVINNIEGLLRKIGKRS